MLMVQERKLFDKLGTHMLLYFKAAHDAFGFIKITPHFFVLFLLSQLFNLFGIFLH